MLRSIVRNFLRLLVALASCCSCANLVAAEPEATPGEWKLVSTSDNVALYRRPRPGPGHYESKAIGEIAASTAVVHAVIDDVDSYSRFMPYTVECRVLKREGDSVLTYQRLSAPLVSDRDYTLRVRTTSKTVEGGTSYLSRWETENALGPAERRGSRSREIVRRRLVARAIRSECDARDLLGLYRQRRSNPCFHQEHRKPDRDPKDFHGDSQASARSEIQGGRRRAEGGKC